MSTTHASFIEVLRTATVNEHRALERTPLMARLMDKDLSVADYTQVLLVFARLYATLDPLLSTVTREYEDLPDGYRYYPRLPYLQRDLAALSALLHDSPDWQPATIEELFTARQDPGLLACAQAQRLTREQTLGLIYVVEGSSQGGKIMTPRLAKQLQLTNSSGLSFFHHFAFEGEAWPALRQMLSALPADGIRRHHQSITVKPPLVCDAACSLFQAITELSAQPQTILAPILCRS